MKNLLIIYFSLIAVVGYSQQVDTVYFDRNWKGVPNKLFADNYVVTLADDGTNMFRTFHIDGTPLARGFYTSIDKQDYSKSVFDGECIEYYPNGNFRSLRHYENGDLNGLQADYYDNGKPQLVTTRTNGEITYIQVYLENGQLSKEMDIKQGQVHGEYKEYYESGVLGVYKTYVDGQEQGVVKYYNTDGSLAYSSNMNNNMLDGEEIYYQNDSPAVIKRYKRGLPVGLQEDRRSASMSEEIYKEIEVNSKNIRMSCYVYNAAIPIKETGKLMAMMYGTQTDTKYKSFLNFVIAFKNDSDNELMSSIKDVKVEYINKKKASKNLAYSETDAVALFETSATVETSKAYNDAAYIAQSAASQTTSSTSEGTTYNSTSISSRTRTNSSSVAAAVGASIAGLVGGNNNGYSAAASGASVSGAVGASASQTNTATTGNISQSSYSSNSSTTTHVDGYTQYQVYNEEAKKAEDVAINAANNFMQRMELVQYSTIRMSPTELSYKWILAEMQNKYDEVRLSFTIDGIPCEIEFTAQEVAGIL